MAHATKCGASGFLALMTSRLLSFLHSADGMKNENTKIDSKIKIISLIFLNDIMDNMSNILIPMLLESGTYPLEKILLHCSGGNLFPA